MSGTPAWPLVGRSEELDLLADVLRDGSGSAVIAGPAGVGKSRLAAALADRLAADDVPVRTVRATRSTATIAFGAFAPWVPAEATGDRLQVLRGVAAALVGSLDHVVVAVDDAHLLDDGSAALVLHLASDRRVSVVATVRSGEPCPDAVSALWKEGIATRVDLQPLAEPETAALLMAALGGPVDGSARAQLWELTRGLPLYVREVVRVAVDQAVLATSDGLWVWTGGLAGSDQLDELIQDRVAGVEDGARDLLDLVAVGEPLPLPIVDELGHRAEVAVLERRGLVVVDVDGTDDAVAQVRFAHPLYGEVVRVQVPVGRTRELSGRLARAATAVGWLARDPLAVAGWALDSDVPLAPADALAAARRALALAEWRLADRLGAAALAASDPSVVADTAAAVLTQTVALGPQARVDTDRFQLAIAALASLDDATAAELVGEAARVHAWATFFSAGSVDIDAAIASTLALPRPVRHEALAHCAFQAVMCCRPAGAHALVAAARRPELGAVPPVVGVQLGAVDAFALALEGRSAAAVEAAEAVLPEVAAVLAADPVPGNPAGATPVAFCLALVLEGRITDATAVAELILAGVDPDVRPVRSLAASLAARMRLFAGDLDAAAAGADEAFRTCRETGQLPAAHWPAAVLAMAGAQAGRTAEGEAALARALAGTEPPPMYAHERRVAQAWLDAASGRAPAARDRLAGSIELARSEGTVAFAWLALLDLVRLGGAADAADLVGALPEPSGRFPAVIADYARAVAAGDGDALTACATAFEDMGALLLAAEAAASAAARHAADGRAGSAGTERGRARVLAARCGSPTTPALADLVADPVLRSLTAREREVVELAARGLTNREIGDELFVSVRTVNTHLYRAYAKLGVNDRDQLGPLLRAGSEGENA